MGGEKEKVMQDEKVKRIRSRDGDRTERWKRRSGSKSRNTVYIKNELGEIRRRLKRKWR